jgi:hypothetical protein
MYRFIFVLFVLFLSFSAWPQNTYNVYINEIRANDAGQDNREFLELIGPAGTVLTNFRIAHHNGASGSDGEVWSSTIGTFNIPDDGITDNNGTALGFYVLGDNHVTNVDETTGWTNDRLIDTTAGLILYDDLNNIIDAVVWGNAGDLTVDDPGTVTITPPTNADNYLHVTVADDAGNNSLEAPNDIVGDDGSGWTNSGETPGAINTAQTGGDVALPVMLSSFGAIAEQNHIILEWVTESEVNNLGFEILRSTQNPDNFVLISSYQYNTALQGQGNTNNRTEYSYTDNSVDESLAYWYKLVDVDFNGNRTGHGPISANLNANTIGDFVLHQNYPNPFNSSTTLSYELPKATFVRIDVFNALGQKIRSISANQNAGLQRVIWDGRNKMNQIVSSGIYYYTVQAGDKLESKRMILLK